MVFGLPGNPVGSLVCFELFARPAIAKMMGRADGGLPRRTARLASAFTHRGDRPTYFPAHVEHASRRARAEDPATSRTPEGMLHESLYVTPLPWRGSADLASVAAANALIHFPPGDRTYIPGEHVDVLIV
jgi:molybdopterin molybdotransferase